MADVVIFGVGDFARLASIYLRDDSEHDVVAFAVDEQYIEAPDILGVPVVAAERLPETHPPERFKTFVAIGFSKVNRARAAVYDRLTVEGYECISYVHSSVQRWPETEIGANCFVFEANVVQPFVRLGNDVILWSGNHIGHDSVIGDHCFIASHVVVSGNCTIGERCFIGVNATLRDGIAIADDCVIGAGAIILSDTEPGGVYGAKATEAHSRKSWELRM
jgi:sugar O-acyltransferase (sialic acid O-acetyltransferase NeuD family)